MQSPIKEELEVHGWIVQKQIQPGENAATTEFRKDPAALGVAQLITRARNLGASQPKLERAVNHVDRQTALVQLVKAREACRAAEGNPAWELKIWLSPFHKNTPADAVRFAFNDAATGDEAAHQTSAQERANVIQQMSDEDCQIFYTWCNNGIRRLGEVQKPSLRDGTGESVDFEKDFENI